MAVSSLIMAMSFFWYVLGCGSLRGQLRFIGGVVNHTSSLNYVSNDLGQLQHIFCSDVAGLSHHILPSQGGAHSAIWWYARLHAAWCAPGWCYLAHQPPILRYGINLARKNMCHMSHIPGYGGIFAHYGCVFFL
jgi:hypothetical protein